MKNLIKKYGFKAMSIGMMALALVGMTGITQAAADPNLTAIYASSTAYFTDNIPALLTFVAYVFLALAGVALAFGGLRWVYGKIKHLFKK